MVAGYSHPTLDVESVKMDVPAAETPPSKRSSRKLSNTAKPSECCVANTILW
jgi:hypothetical protein